MCENRTDHLKSKLRLNKISTLIFFQFYRKINRNLSEILLEASYGLHPNKYFEILNQTFGGRSPVTKRSRLHPNS